MMLRFRLNGQDIEVETAPDRRAVDLLRDVGLLRDVDSLRATLDVKEGCGTGECGACSVLVDGAHKLSCLLLAAQLEGREVTTPAGLGNAAAPHAIQHALAAHGAVQCGFCTPGMSIAAAALLAENPDPTRADIRTAISGNLCRCTGYVMIVDAVEEAARKMRGDSEPLHDSEPLYDAARASRKKTAATRKKGGKP